MGLEEGGKGISRPRGPVGIRVTVDRNLRGVHLA